MTPRPVSHSLGPNAAARPIDVLCLGIVVADHVCAPIAAFPPQGGLVTTPRLELAIGGCAANVAVDLVRLGVRAVVGGRVGDDVLGRFVADELTSQGVNCPHLVRSSTAQTAATLVINVAGEDRRFLHAVGANAEFTGREIPPAALASSRIVYVGGFGLNPAMSGDSIAELFRTARTHGAMTVLDVVVGDAAALTAMLAAALPETDLFHLNLDEAQLICGETDPLQQARHFRALGARSVVITCGSDGVLLANAQETLSAPAYPVLCLDGTGGGDAFVAGYLYGVLHSADTRRCLAYGSALGMSCVRAMGATAGVFRREELESYIAQHPLPVQNVGQ